MPPKKPVRKNARKFSKSKTAGLNRKEKAEVTALAKKAVTTLAEHKYMNNNDEALTQQIPFYIQNNRVVSCIGYSTTVNAQPDGGAFQYPNGHNMREMKLLRPFTDSNVYEDLQAYAPIGKEIRPISSRTRWRVDRDFTKITSYFANNEGGSDPAAPGS